MVRESLQEATKSDDSVRKNMVRPSKPAARSTAGLPERSNRQQSPHRFSRQRKKKFSFRAGHCSHSLSRPRQIHEAPAASGGGGKSKSGEINSSCFFDPESRETVESLGFSIKDTPNVLLIPLGGRLGYCVHNWNKLRLEIGLLLLLAENPDSTGGAYNILDSEAKELFQKMQLKNLIMNKGISLDPILKWLKLVLQANKDTFSISLPHRRLDQRRIFCVSLDF